MQVAGAFVSDKLSNSNTQTCSAWSFSDDGCSSSHESLSACLALQPPSEHSNSQPPASVPDPGPSAAEKETGEKPHPRSRGSGRCVSRRTAPAHGPCACTTSRTAHACARSTCTAGCPTAGLAGRGQDVGCGMVLCQLGPWACMPPPGPVLTQRTSLGLHPSPRPHHRLHGVSIHTCKLIQYTHAAPRTSYPES